MLYSVFCFLFFFSNEILPRSSSEALGVQCGGSTIPYTQPQLPPATSLQALAWNWDLKKRGWKPSVPTDKGHLIANEGAALNSC